MIALPQLQHELRRAAARRARPHHARRFRRGALILAFAVATAVAGAAAAGWFTVDEGTTSRGDFEIRVAQPPDDSDDATYEVARVGGRKGQICLELRFAKVRPVYGCGEVPTAKSPIGLVVVDRNAEPSRRLVFGVVDPSVASVLIGKVRVRPRAEAAIERGRFFVGMVPDRGPVFIRVEDRAGVVLAELGSQTTTTRKLRSMDDARAAGDPAGFAPTVRPPSAYVYRGKEISGADVAKLGLSCVEDETPVVRCFDTPGEGEGARRRR